MNKTSAIVILCLLSNKAILGMDINSPNLLTLISTVPNDVQKLILLSPKGGWWYCKQIYDHDSRVYSASSDSTYFATGTENEMARISKINILQQWAGSDYKRSLYSVSWNPDDTFLATGSTDIARIFNVNTQQQWAGFGYISNCPVHSVSWDHNGMYLAMAPFSINALIFDVNKKQLVARFGHDKFVNAVSWNNDGTRLATGSNDDKARIFDAKTERLLFCFDHEDFVSAVSWNNDGTRLATGSNDDKARIFDAITGQLLFCFDHDNAVNAVSWNDDGTRLATGSDDNKVRIFDVTGRLLFCFDHDDAVNAVSWNNDGTRLATGSDDNKVRIFDVITEQLLFCFDHDNAVNAVSWSHDGTRLATGSEDNKARIFEKYANTTLPQLILKCALSVWLLIEKPSKNINTSELLLSAVAHKCQLNEGNIRDTWNSFPEDMKNALWRTMHYRIEKYGKEIS